MRPTRRHERSDDQPRRAKLCHALRALDNRVMEAMGTLGPRRTSALLLAISLLFAGAMLAVAWVLKPESSQTLVYVLIAVWWIPFSLLSTAANASRRARCGNRY